MIRGASVASPWRVRPNRRDRCICRPHGRRIVAAPGPKAIPSGPSSWWFRPGPEAAPTPSCGRWRRQPAPLLGQSIVILNKPGASGTIGVGYVTRSEPDGYTIGGVPSGAITMAPHVAAQSFQATDYRIVAMITQAAGVLCVHPDFPAKNATRVPHRAEEQPRQIHLWFGRRRRLRPVLDGADLPALRVSASASFPIRAPTRP